MSALHLNPHFAAQLPKMRGSHEVFGDERVCMAYQDQGNFRREIAESPDVQEVLSNVTARVMRNARDLTWTEARAD